MREENKQWMQTYHPADHWVQAPQGRVRCNLCPRYCRVLEGKSGFCGVRKNINGVLQSLNYGKSVPITCESIETEAVFHYAPGEAILSLGNVGCMMKCDFCQNWSTSQSRLVLDENIINITPQGVVDYALKHHIRMLSWTYNDPVVWHEFVMDTARLAQAQGIRNLYKSAFYITKEGIDDLIEVMDIFSISIKSLNEGMYLKTTKGKMQPVLDGVLQVYQAIQKGADIHLELSNLCVTGRNDNLEESMHVANWMLEHLDANVPLHYVRFHPDYLYTDVERTDPAFLEIARTKAMEAGLKYVYVGNVHGTPSSNTYCPTCGAAVVERYGLISTNHLVNGCCPDCSMPIPIKMPWKNTKAVAENIQVPQEYKNTLHSFRGVIRSCHVEKAGQDAVYYQFESADGTVLSAIGKNSVDRFMLSSPHEDASQVRLFYKDAVPRVFEVYDRAHFPTSVASQTILLSEHVPPILGDQTIVPSYHRLTLFTYTPDELHRAFYSLTHYVVVLDYKSL